MPSDPWQQISAPTEAPISARRVDAHHPHGFYWARDLEGNCLLVFEYSRAIEIKDRRPRLRQIRITEALADSRIARFILELTHSESREIFHRLCLDIIESTRRCGDERTALATLLRRTWRWHGMLKGGHEERLSPEAQKGLIGELKVLEVALFPYFQASDALRFWRGPEGAPKDFSIGRIAIEAKARRGAAKPEVHISSEHQLDDEGVERLFLSVTAVDEAASGAPRALTLTQYVARIEEIAIANDAGSVDLLEGRLMEAGYTSVQDYSDTFWTIGDTRWFKVSDSFPRLVGSSLPDSIGSVRYHIDLPSCSEWEVELEEVVVSFAGGIK